MNLLETLKTGRVTRYHNAPIHNKQHMDSHHWETAVILMRIYPECSKELLFYALTHDCGEAYTGDLPAPIKRQLPELKEKLDALEDYYVRVALGIMHPEFSDFEKLAVKHADILSGIYFTSMWLRAGDQDAKAISIKWAEYYGALPYLNRESIEVSQELFDDCE
jgi:5'-deoxynucleotidase YfbR-like HD superfamily hydrolase